jgi:hypothetical protein
MRNKKELINIEKEKARKRPDSHNQLHYLYMERIGPIVPTSAFSIGRAELKKFRTALQVPVDEFKLAIEGLCDAFVNEGAFEQFRINTRYLKSYAIELDRACRNLISLLELRKESFDGYLTVTNLLTKNSGTARLRVSRDEILALPKTLETFAADVSRIARDHLPTKNKTGGQEDRAFNEFIIGLLLVADWANANTQLPGKGETKPDKSNPLRDFAKAVLKFATERGIKGLKSSGLPREDREKVKRRLTRYGAQEVTDSLRLAKKPIQRKARRRTRAG